jgi:hypothetical protein
MANTRYDSESWLEDVAVRERAIPLDREPFAAAREDQYLVEHGVGTVAPRGVRLAARPPSFSCYERVPGCTERSGGKSASRSAASTWYRSSGSRRPWNLQVPRLLRLIPSARDVSTAERTADETTI